jgi:hypothetical protein
MSFISCIAIIHGIHSPHSHTGTEEKQMALILYTEAGLAAFARHHRTNRSVTLPPVLGTVYELPPSEYWDNGWTPTEGGAAPVVTL